ncbi:aminodeoxychorismate lyase [Halomonas sp. BLK-85]
MSTLSTVPFDDRGLAYGDGVFETVLLRGGQPVLWQYHRARLLRGCATLAISPPSDQALEACWQASSGQASDTGLEVLKIIVTRGSGGRGYACPPDPAPRLLSHRSSFTPIPQRWREGISVCVCQLRLGHQPLLAGIKHLNRLENVMARRECQHPAIAEGLLADQQGNLIEATSMNVFWQAGGRLWTPELEQCGVAGTLRAALLEQGWVREGTLPLSSLQDVERLWVANSVQGVWPVTVLVSSTTGEHLQRLPLAADDPLQALAHPLMGYPPDNAG